MLTWLSSNAAALGVLGSVAAFAWSAFKFNAVRRKEQEVHEFEAFHRLIKEVVSPDPETKATWIDRQVAAIFELRHFRRYYEVTIRILTALRERWIPILNRTIRAF